VNGFCPLLGRYLDASAAPADPLLLPGCTAPLKPVCSSSTNSTSSSAQRRPTSPRRWSVPARSGTCCWRWADDQVVTDTLRANHHYVSARGFLESDSFVDVVTLEHLLVIAAHESILRPTMGAADRKAWDGKATVAALLVLERSHAVGAGRAKAPARGRAILRRPRDARHRGGRRGGGETSAKAFQRTPVTIHRCSTLDGDIYGQLSTSKREKLASKLVFLE
jgi:hypothetical protein